VESQRFDDLIRVLAAPKSRRGLLGRFVAAAGAAVVAGLPWQREGVSAQTLPCGDLGCRCTTGPTSNCVPGLVCCPTNGDLPGGTGTCTAPGQCFGGFCSADGVGCPATCRFGANCLDCCSGFCSSGGMCGPSSCRSAGCKCITGTLNPCDEGLACCPTVEGLPGGPGICAPRGICS
jgi:hypothetical protein